MATPDNAAYRRDTLWVAALIHRVSGLLLALFLPFHFLALGLALEGQARLDGFLAFTDHPVVKTAEFVLVFLLALHLLGGIRILVIENLPWRDNQKQLAGYGIFAAGVVALFFLATVLV